MLLASLFLFCFHPTFCSVSFCFSFVMGLFLYFYITFYTQTHSGYCMVLNMYPLLSGCFLDTSKSELWCNFGGLVCLLGFFMKLWHHKWIILFKGHCSYESGKILFKMMLRISLKYLIDNFFMKTSGFVSFWKKCSSEQKHHFPMVLFTMGKQPTIFNDCLRWILYTVDLLSLA